MGTFHDSLPFGVSIEQALSWMGALAMRDGNQEAALELAQIVKDWGATEITMRVPVVHVLCQLADEFRSRGRAESVARVERVVKLLKAGAPQRLVVGSLVLDGSRGPSKLDDQYEQVRKLVVRSVGG